MRRRGAVLAVLGTLLLAAAGCVPAPLRTIDTVIGAGDLDENGDTISGMGGPAVEADIGFPISIAEDGSGNLFVGADDRVFRVDAGGVIVHVAGTGGHTSSGDGGPATEASLGVTDLALDPLGNLFVVSQSRSEVRKVDTTGIISTVVGAAGRGYSGDDGPAAAAQVRSPSGIAIDDAGNLYIADSGNNAVRKVDAAGVMSTVAGTGVAGFSGDGGPASTARLWNPIGVTHDGTGSLFIGDTENYRVRKVDPSGVISTVAGTGTAGYSGDGGPATAAAIRRPWGLHSDSAGSLYFTDTENDRIRKVDPSGVITTVAGTGVAGFAGDGGAAVDAELTFPLDVLALGPGPEADLLVADYGNQRVRRVWSGGAAVGGRVTADGTGVAVADATVEVFALGDLSVPVATDTTDADGRWGVQLPVGSYTIVVAGADPSTVTLDAGARVGVQIVVSPP